MAVQTSVGPIASSILLLRAFDHRDEREHVFLLGDRRCRRFAMDHRRPQIGAALHLDQPRAVLARSMCSTPDFAQIGFDHLPNAGRHARHRERRQAGLRIFRRLGFDRARSARPVPAAISCVCREAQMPEQLMQPRPLLMYTLSTIRSSTLPSGRPRRRPAESC